MAEKKTVSIYGRHCTIIQDNPQGPVIWLGTGDVSDEADGVAALLQKMLPDRAYTLILYEVRDWNKELSPWEAAPVFGDEGFTGCASETLTWLETAVFDIGAYLPDAAGMRNYLAGYSLAGLFSLWALYSSKSFSGAASCSGSLWYPRWSDFIRENQLTSVSRVYLSLGDREENTKNKVMSKVGNMTREQYRILQKTSSVSDCILEWNKGGHFKDIETRLAKGVAWLVNIDK